MSNDLTDITLLSSAEWDNPFWTNKQHTAVELARRGFRVFYIDTPGMRRVSLKAQDTNRIRERFKKALRGPCLRQENLWVWSPLVIPMKNIPWLRWVNKILFQTMLNLYLGHLHIRKDILWTYYPLTTLFLNMSSFGKVIYHCVDEIKAQPGMPAQLIEVEEHKLVKRADIVFTSARKLAETRKLWNPNTHYLPNVADYEHFSKAMLETTIIPNDLLKIPGPRIGFIGAISAYKIDFELLKHVADSHPEWSLVLIGKVGEGDPWTNAEILMNSPNIHLLGPRSYNDLPGYLKGFDVAILPNRINDYTESMFPMKFFEYLAAGRPIVSVNLATLQDYRSLIFLSQNYNEFTAAIQKALDGNVSLLSERLNLAKKYTYTARTTTMLEMINSYENRHNS